MNKFWAHVFQAYREFGRKIYVEKSEELAAEPLFCNDNVQVENRRKKITKTGLIVVCVTSKVF